MGWGCMKINAEGSNLAGIGKDFMMKFTVANSLEASLWRPILQTKLKESDKKRGMKRRSSPKKSRTTHKRNRSGSASRKGPRDDREDYEDDVKKKPPVCVMAAGYAMGYLNECIGGKRDPAAATPSSPSSPSKRKKRRAGREGPKVAVVEVSCEALGHSCCEFICAPADSIETSVKKYLKESGRLEGWEFDRLHMAIVTKGKTEKKSLWSSLLSSMAN